MTIEYLGRKEALLKFIVPPIAEAARATGGRVADLFCGTATVSEAFKREGLRVEANDQLMLGAILARSILEISEEPLMPALRQQLMDHPDSRALALEGAPAYDQALALLNGLSPVEGYCWRSFSPASKEHSGVERMYFTRENAGKIDAIRGQLSEWGSVISDGERALLLRSLVEGISAVSNIAGTWGCYLKTWKSRALKPLRLTRVTIVPGATDHHVSNDDAARIARSVRASVAYIDPPYTKRQYAAYYHVLETVVRNDQPALTGTTGLRDWKQDSSDWCYKRRAPAALQDLVSKLPSQHVFLSYNEDGQISHDRILDIMGNFGDLEVHDTNYRRYKSSRKPHKGLLVKERLYHLRRPA